MACSFKQWHKSVHNNRNYNLKGIIDNYDFCYNRAALVESLMGVSCRVAYSACGVEKLKLH